MTRIKSEDDNAAVITSVNLAKSMFILSSILIFRNGAAQQWFETASLSTNWSSMGCSADANFWVAAYAHVDAGYLCRSIDAGATWSSYTTPFTDWSSVTVSSDGAFAFAASTRDGIYVSTNAGQTWATTSVSSGAWAAIATSADGRRIFVGGFDECLRSEDSGATWIPTLTNVALAGFVVRGVASSADGRNLIAVTTKYNYPATYASPVYLSHDAGLTWSTVPIQTNAGGWISVACSAEATAIIAAAPYYGVYFTTNGGATWAQTNFMMVLRVTCSADGSHLAAAGYNGAIYTSQDSGASWSTTRPANPNAEWNALAMSADGCRLAAAVYNGRIWVSQTTPTPVLAAIRSGPDLLLSWIVPSISFGLQECSDLSAQDWTEVLKPAALNYTNLHCEVAVPVSQGNRFFRLLSR